VLINLSRTLAPLDRQDTGNRILDALPQYDFDRLRYHLEPVSLSLKQTLHHSGTEILFVYFPVHGMISVVSTLGDGSAVEVGTVGNEGLVGLPALLGATMTPHQVVVQGAGGGFRASVPALRREFNQSNNFRDLVLKFTNLFLAEVSQTAACNARHGVDARCARWLLTMRDRFGSDRFPITHELLAMLLGVRRAGVTGAAMGLQRNGVIRYNHGQVEILDRAGLEATSCECYGAIKNQIDRFSSGIEPPSRWAPSEQHHDRRTVVLVLEDDDSCRDMTRGILRAAGFDVICARNFDEAVHCVEEPAKIDIALIDVRMPAGSPHGISFARVAQTRRPSLKVIFMSSHSRSADLKLIDEDEAFLCKPFAPRQLLDVVARTAA
jgi:CRP-like cAMP-binding protein